MPSDWRERPCRRHVTTRASPFRGVSIVCGRNRRAAEAGCELHYRGGRRHAGPHPYAGVAFLSKNQSTLSITVRSRHLRAGLAVSSSSRELDVTAGGSAVTGTLPRRYPSLYRCRDGSCIHCDRCIRICDELQGQFVWEAIGRGDATYVAPGRGETMLEGGCVSCGACADTCPSGALFDKRSPAQTSSWTRSTCVYCGVGCQMEVGAYEGRIVAVRPADSP